MPYINADGRRQIRHGAPPVTPGGLNYVLTRILIWDGPNERKIWTAIQRYLDTNGRSYTTINDILGALYCAGHEYYRRTGKSFGVQLGEIAGLFYSDVAAPYEDQKIKENGDVYPRKLIQKRSKRKNKS